MAVPALLRIATRSSPLAIWQSEFVASRLRAWLVGVGVDVRVELVGVETHGDRTQEANVPLHSIGGQGVFVKEVEQAVLEGRAHIAVHSAKDLPTQLADGLVLAAVPLRDDVRDAMVGMRIDMLPRNARVATGSIRRRAQLQSKRPDLRFHELRGNMHTRVAKAAGFDAVVVGAAALTRLGLGSHIAETVAPEVMLPMIGQGAIAVECRAADTDLCQLLACIDDPFLHDAVRAERTFLARLGSGCELPVAALAQPLSDGRRGLELRAVVLSKDGVQTARAHVRGTDPTVLGNEAADAVLASGAAEMLRT
jgi:hydroxymethylbilane synthase